MRALMTAALCIALAGCGTSTGATNDTDRGSAMDRPLTRISLTSDAFADGQPIPAQYTCDGADESPALHWGEPPVGTKGFVLVVDDPDAPGGIFRHWGLADIPANARSIAAGQSLGTPMINDFGKPGYGGPCPPRGHGQHHFHFKLFALDAVLPGIAGNAKDATLEEEAARHAVARGELVGTYERR